MVYKKEKSYECTKCGMKFKAFAKATGGGTDQQGKKISCISNKIFCPMCGKNLKTWDSHYERDIIRIQTK